MLGLDRSCTALLTGPFFSARQVYLLVSDDLAHVWAIPLRRVVTAHKLRFLVGPALYNAYRMSLEQAREHVWAID